MIVLFLLTSEVATSQSFYAVRRPRNLMIMGGTGTTHYKGDLQDPGRLTKTRYNISAGAEYFVHPLISTRVELTYFRLAGADAASKDQERRDRNLSFFSGNVELSTAATINLLKTPPRKFYQRPVFNLYLLGGGGGLYSSAKTIRDNGEKIALQPIRTEGVKYSRLHPIVFGGAGLRIFYNPFFNILVEASYRFTFTDHLDDVATKRYYNDSRATYTLTDPLAIELNKRAIGPALVRANPENNDGYLFMNLKVQYYLEGEFFTKGQNKLFTVKRRGTRRR